MKNLSSGGASAGSLLIEGQSDTNKGSKKLLRAPVKALHLMSSCISAGLIELPEQAGRRTTLYG